MNFNTKNLSFATWLGFFCLLILLLALGTWQLARLKEKNDFIKSINYNIVNKAKKIDNFDQTVNLYDKITVTGRFIPDTNIFLYGRRSAMPEKNGYYLLSVFETTNKERVLVSRGWLPQQVKDEILQNTDSLQTELFSEEITGFMLAGERKTFFVPENDYERNIWFNIDLNMAKKLLNINVTDFYLMQVNASDLPANSKILSAENLSKIRNDHLEYAITWYSLAICLFFIFLSYSRRQN